MSNFSGYEFPKPFIRQGAFPLDDSYIHETYDDANSYVQNNPIAYIGQVIAVKDEILKTVRLFVVGYSGTLIRIDGIESIHADDRSISFENGTISLFEFEQIQSEGMSLRTKADGEGGYKLEWFNLDEKFQDFANRLLELDDKISERVKYSDAMTEEQMNEILNDILSIE